MKERIVTTVMVMILAGCSAGRQNVTDKTTALSLDSESSKFSYAVGLDVGKSLKSIGTRLDLNAFDIAVASVIKGEKPILSAKESIAAKRSVFKVQRNRLLAKRKGLGLKNKREGEKFLTNNAAEEGVTTTSSGLEYQVIKPGDGPKPKPTDEVKVNYRGTLIDGTVFDSSYKRGHPATFSLNHVIKGWTEGLQLMSVGSKYRFFLPSELAYGARGAGAKIGPNATLIFDVELLSIEK